jgi:hypothetical protein
VASSEVSTDGVLYVLIVAFVLNMLMSGALSYMIAWINTLQLIIHLPMMFIVVPSNVSAFLSIIIPIVTFDILESEQSTEHIMEFEAFPE